MRILAISDYYIPGFRGGTIRALAHIVQRLSGRHEFWVITTNRDVSQTSAYPDIQPDAWTRQSDGSRVYYADRSRLTSSVLRRLVLEVRPDLLFPFSVFSPFTIRLLAMRRAGVVPRLPVLIAPEGEFSPGALAQKARKKEAFLRAARTLGLYRDVHWKATSDLEAGDIKRSVGPQAVVHLSPSLPPPGPAVDRPRERIEKIAGHARFVYLSRVTPKKNLLFLLDRFAGLTGSCDLDIVGPTDDEVYGARCRERAASMPAGVRVTFTGEVPHERVAAELALRHVFVLPTLGENFGFAILEAFATGRPVIVSDRTPWRGLVQHRAGWDLSLDDPGVWTTTLQAAIDMDQATYEQWSESAWAFARAYADLPRLEQALETAFARASARELRA